MRLLLQFAICFFLAVATVNFGVAVFWNRLHSATRQWWPS